MPPTTTRRGGRLRPIIAIAVLLALIVCAFAGVRLGAFLVKEDPLQSADAILVLSGTRLMRPLEGADLYREGFSKQIMLTEETRDAGVAYVVRRGISYPTDAELARDVLVRMGVPPAAILIPPTVHDNTAAEAHTLRLAALERKWHRVIVVTSKMHTRRAGFAVRRELNGTGIEIVVRASRYDPADPEHWWRSRADVRFVGAETAKLAAYLLGLGM